MNEGKKPQILVVDDERTQRKTLCDMVGDHGYRSITAEGGRDALKKVEENAFALALIDIRLGDISGLEVLKRIRSVKPDVECILITAHASQESAIEALNLGAYSYLQKPLDAERLLIAVERALEKRVAERELRELKAFHEGIVQNMTEGIAVEDKGGHFTFLNPAACRLLGYSQEELSGEHWTTVIPPDQQEIVREANRRREGGVSSRYEVQVEHKDGSRLQVLVSGAPRFEGGEFVGTLAVFTDITERIQAEKQMRLQSVALGAAANAILIIDAEGKIEWVNPAFSELTGYEREEVIGQDLGILKPELQSQDFYADLWATIEAGDPWQGQLINRRKNGEHYVEEQTITPVEDEEGDITHYIAIKQDVTDRVKAEHTLKRQVEKLKVLNALAVSGTEATSHDELISHAVGILADTLYPDLVEVLLVDEGRDALVTHPSSHGLKVSDDLLNIPMGKGIVGSVAQSGQPKLVPDVTQEPTYIEVNPQIRSEVCVPIKVGKRVLGVINVENANLNAFDEDDQRLLTTFAGQLATAMERTRLFAEVQGRVEELKAVAAVSSELVKVRDREEMLPVIVNHICEVLQTHHGGIAIKFPDQDKLEIEFGRGIWAEQRGERRPMDSGVSGHVMVTGEPYLSDDARGEPLLLNPELLGEVRAVACLPLLVSGETIGALWAGRAKAFQDNELDILTAIADITANAIHRATLYHQTRTQVKRLKALNRIDRTISSSLDISLTLDVLLQEATNQLGVDGGDVLLYDPNMQVLECVAVEGFQNGTIEGRTIRLGEGHAGKVALDRKMIHIPDFYDSEVEIKNKLSYMDKESFRAYAATPLIAKGEIKGVLEVYHRTPLDPGRDWFEYLETLSTQTAIAIDHMSMFEELQLSHMELTQSYEKTLEGWAKALELRDHKTQGHSRRVTELTLQLAKELDVTESALRYIRWGALLHDIGKMGVPDRILRKPGELTDEEWAVMKKHPTFAYKLLSPIDHLKPALDIPRYHHERWDGGGYPEGLKGEEIPLAARIFAVVDVWDALRSDRPYRDAWSGEKALEHIQEQRGKHFDPRVVEVFMDNVENGRAEGSISLQTL